MPQNTAQSQRLTKKQRKGIAFRQKLGKNRKAGKLGDLHSENAPVPESDIVIDDEADLEASKNINPNADDSPSDRRRSETLNGKVQQRQDQKQKQKQKQSSGEGDVKSKRDVEFGADTRTRTGSISGSGTERPSKKRKRPQVEAGGANLDRNADSDADTNADAPSKPKKRKQKPSEEEDETVDDSEGNIENGDAKSSSKHKTRYILFIGNLKYTTTEEAIQAHFAHIDPAPTIRLLTPKPSSTKSKSSTTTKSKGCAFLEFTSHASLQHALKLHHSALDGRQINVELTAGGGGKSSTRLEKLKGRNRKLEVQRNKHLQKSTVDPSSDPTTSQGQRHSSTSGTSELPPISKRRTWSVAEAGDEDTTHRGGKKHNLNSSSKKQRGLKKRKDKNLGTGVNSIPVG